MKRNVERQWVVNVLPGINETPIASLECMDIKEIQQGRNGRLTICLTKEQMKYLQMMSYVGSNKDGYMLVVALSGTKKKSRRLR